MPRDESPESPKKRRPRPLWVRALVVMLLAYIGWCAVLYVKQDDLIFPRQLAGAGMPNPPVRGAGAMERVWIESDGGVQVEGWYFKTALASAKRPQPCILRFHGNGELIDHMLDSADFFLGRGLNVMLVEYRGYGRSGGADTPAGRPRGEPSERAIVADSLKFLDWLAARPEVDSTRLVYSGHSLGSGVAAQLAARRRPAAVILECPFTSIAAMALGYGAPPFIVKHPFRTDAVLPPLAAAGLPVLILHSRHDEIVPFSHGQRLAKLVPSATFVELDGSHNSAMVGQPEYERAVDEFLARSGLVTSPRRGSPPAR